MTSLHIKGLSVGYATKEIATNINLSLSGGQLVCLLGQNGVGKSTLLRTLSNLQEPLAGHIEIDHQDIRALDRRKLATKLGIITTEKIGMSNMTVRELVALGRYPYTNWVGQESKEDTQKIEEAISRCRINYIEKSKLSAISDGQFQKAMVGRVLAQDTDIILMDEPTAHLDVVNRVEMFQLLQSIVQETDKSILISTHELDLSMQFADELWLMNFNAPIVIGTPEDLGLTGEIEKIFFHEEFHLDSRTGQVKLRQEVKESFNLVGEDKAFHWVQKALERKGYGISPEGVRIAVEFVDNQLVWSFDNHKGQNIRELLEIIDKK
ncbi:iron complex transport system ATP-binding protein [Reichenbachiella faecimaris]|uniref:Iron complex transport system ATP-binding protein n=1 Tax=Reichenbachiella faecimaris TaxID=692418 RepID=A0A1W2GQV3_REIFA|nr:ABC transporter ATP-binding protein [Reichenbachiella faecimaris]SMD38738.1 iron complex transport system ATP-binding protein [Reichenbachiella faecimaris]